MLGPFDQHQSMRRAITHAAKGVASAPKFLGPLHLIPSHCSLT